MARGQAPSLSAWVSEALRLKLEHDRRLQALAEFVSAFEAEHGAISDEEMRLAARRAHARALTVREIRDQPPRKRRRAGGAKR